MDNLQKFRQEINNIDAEIILLLEKRLQIAIKICEEKNKHQQEIKDPKRENEILEFWQTSATKLTPEFIQEILSAILKESRRSQKQHILKKTK